MCIPFHQLGLTTSTDTVSQGDENTTPHADETSNMSSTRSETSDGQEGTNLTGTSSDASWIVGTHIYYALLCIAVLTMIILIIWYIRRTQNTHVGGAKDCEVQGYKEVSKNEDPRACDSSNSSNSSTHQTVDDNFPANENQEEGAIETPSNQTSSGEPLSTVEQSLCV